MAEIVEKPQLRYTTDNLAIAEMLVQFPGVRAEDPPATLKVVGWGNLAQEIEQSYHKGDRVIIEGRLNMNTLQLDGYKEKRAELTAQKIHPLGAGVSIDASTSSTGETSSYATAGDARESRSPEVEKKATAVGVAAKSEPAKPVSQPKPPLPTLEADVDDIPF
jgi:single-stranded DNA-binding protein